MGEGDNAPEETPAAATIPIVVISAPLELWKLLALGLVCPSTFLKIICRQYASH